MVVIFTKLYGLKCLNDYLRAAMQPYFLFDSLIDFGSGSFMLQCFLLLHPILAKLHQFEMVKSSHFLTPC